jgi:hypothetical protein
VLTVDLPVLGYRERERRHGFHGADAIVVSNHGGRQLDRVAATVDVLEEVVEAVRGSPSPDDVTRAHVDRG